MLCHLFCVFGFVSSALVSVVFLPLSYGLQGISAEEGSRKYKLEVGTEDKPGRFPGKDATVNSAFLEPLLSSFWVLVCVCQWPGFGRSRSSIWMLKRRKLFVFPGDLAMVSDLESGSKHQTQMVYLSLAPSGGPQFLFSSHFDLCFLVSVLARERKWAADKLSPGFSFGLFSRAS